MLGHTPALAPQTYHRGFEGLIAGDTAISRIDGQAGQLWLRGYRVEDLAVHATFEQTAWLIVNGELPTRAQLADFVGELGWWWNPPVGALRVLEALPPQSSLMARFRTAVLVAAATVRTAGDTTVDAQRRKVPRILSWTVALAAACIRQSLGYPVYESPNTSEVHAAGLAERFLWSALLKRPEPEAIRAFEISLIVQAEHDIHAAALAALAIASSGAGLDHAVVAGIGALSGDLHGGANVPAFELIHDLKTPAAARQWAKQRIAEKGRIPGFGHRVYKTHDPRGRVLAPWAQRLSTMSGHPDWWTTFEALRHEIESALGPKGIYANVDAYTGLIYAPLGLPLAAFTIPFCLAIQVGWMAHALEYLATSGPPLRVQIS